MDSEHILTLCRAREKYNEVKRQTSSERSEIQETHRSVSALLLETMRRSDHDCIRCVQDDGSAIYIQVKKPTRRTKTLKTVEDVMSLLQNVAENVTHVPSEDLPDAIARLVESRAKAQGTEIPPKLSIVPRVGIRKTIVEHVNAPREIQTLTTQVASNHSEKKRLRELVAPAYNEFKAAQTKVCNHVETSASELDEVVQMKTHAVDGTVSKTMNMKVSTIQCPKRRNIYGIRSVCGYVKEAVPSVPGRGDDFDEQLRTHVRRVIEREQEATVTERKVVIRRAKP